jgi:hypothetical protein
VYEQKQCGFCDLRSDDPAEFTNHMRAAHPQFFVSTVGPPERGLPLAGALIVAALFGGTCGLPLLLMANVEPIRELSAIPAYYLDALRDLGPFVLPAAALMGFFYPRLSYRWGLVLGWAMLSVSVLFVSASLLDPARNIAQLAYFATPVFVVVVMSAVAWAAAALRRRFRPG